MFARGAMNFEDYNYDNYNKFILVDPTKTPNETENESEQSESSV